MTPFHFGPFFTFFYEIQREFIGVREDFDGETIEFEGHLKGVLRGAYSRFQ